MIIIYLMLTTYYLLLPAVAKAFCPVCTVTVGAGIGLSRWLGIDDTITGLWIGGLTISLIGWTLNWLSSKKIIFKLRKMMVASTYYLIILLPLFWTNTIGHPLNTIFGVDKLVFGIVLGSLVFLGGGLLYQKTKQNNNEKALFPFQKVVMPVAPLVILSVLFYYLT